MQISIWEAAKVNYINVAVNVSAKQFRDTYLPEYITSILKDYGCNIIRGYYYSKPLCVKGF